METINKKTGEIKTIRVKGLWSHFPIPAYQVLARQQEWKAQKLLTCFVSFLGSEGYCVFPSYTTISLRCGLGRNSIRKALTVLEDNGFVVTFYYKDGKKDRNRYYLQEACWDSGKMNRVAAEFRTATHKCLDCGELVDRGGFGVSPKKTSNHWGCGGPVVRLISLKSKKLSPQVEVI